MLKRVLAAGLTIGLAALLLFSCGGNSGTTTPTPGTGGLFTFLGDAPVCDALSLRLAITGLTLTPQGGGNEVGVIQTTATSAPSILVNFASLRDSPTLISVTNVTEGTYDQGAFAFSTPKLVVFDPTQSPPVLIPIVEFTTLAPTFTINPPLVIVKDKVQALRIDFDMTRSLEVDALGQATGNATPVLSAAPTVANESQGLGEMDDLVGFVRTVSASNANPGYVGNIGLQILSGSGPSLVIRLTDDTELNGVPALNQLETGRVVEVDAYVDDTGNIVAKTVEVENRAVVEQAQLAFLGNITSVTKDADGNVTQFEFYVREEEPNVNYYVPLDSLVEVNVSTSTAFQVSSRPTNFLDLPIDATALAPGQELIVHGTYTTVQDEPTTVDADSIYLRLQTVQGNFSSAVQVGSDGKTGAFWLTPCCSVFQGAPILVFTNSDTAFLNVFGLSQLTPHGTLLVRGLPFLQAQGGTLNSVSVPAGTLVMTARQVHQLQ
jgi:hypothetical protein